MDTILEQNAAPITALPQEPSLPRGEHLSYKFQRLRERIRQAVVTGELAGKLPGERELARRFKANPKTLSKALTDLAAEGLLDRSIGRGTYVRGAETPAASGNGTGKWLILCEPGQTGSPMVEQIRRLHPQAETATLEKPFRPSFLNQFSAVIDLCAGTPEAFHRDLLVRGIISLLVGREGGQCQLHAVLLDRAYAAACVAREIFLAGHQRVLVVEDVADTTVSHAARMAASRYLPQALVESATIENVAAITAAGNSAILCANEKYAQQVEQLLQSHPDLAHVSLAAIGWYDKEAPCTGVYTTPSDLALAASNLLRDANPHRPTVLWLSGACVDRGTLHAVHESSPNAGGPHRPTAMSA
jgi:hypothetical protein